MGFFGSDSNTTGFQEFARMNVDPGNFFGPQPIESFTMPTLSPEQKKALNDLIARLSGAAPRTFSGDPNVAMSSLGETSLAGLENRALELSDPNFQTDLEQREIDTLMQMMDFQGQNQDVNEFFDTTIRDPALESFREDVLPSIGREFGGDNFFGSERRSADQRAQEELIDSLTRQRSDINFRSDEANRNRALEALGLSTTRTKARADERLGIFGAGMEQTALAERNVSREFEQFLVEAGLEDEQIKMLLASIAIPQFENIVVGGGSGADAGQGASAAASIASMFSDRRLKKNIQKIGEFMGFNIYRWNWNEFAERLGIDGPTTGVIAQEVSWTGHVVRSGGFLKIDYAKLFGVS